MNKDQLEIAKNQVFLSLCDRNEYLWGCICEEALRECELPDDCDDAEDVCDAVDKLMVACQDAAKEALDRIDLDALLEQEKSS